MLDTQYNGVGYDYLRGAVGTVVLGVGGAAAGIKSQNTQMYKCTECGITLSYAMPQNIKLAIDMGVVNESVRNDLEIDGVPISWDSLKRRYKNIEEGMADEMRKQREQREQSAKEKMTSLLLSYATASKEEFDNAIDVVVDYGKKWWLVKKGGSTPLAERPMTFEEYISYHDAVKTVIENIAKFFPRKNSSDEPFDEYREFGYYKLESLFATYVKERIREENGSLIIPRRGSDVEEYSVVNPFVKSFAESYLGETLWLNYEDCCFMDTVFFEEKSIPKASFGVIIPCYIENNSRIAYHCLSNSTKKEKSGDRFIEDYFSVYPEKRQIYKKKIVEIQEEIQKNKTLLYDLGVEIESLKTTSEQQKALLKNKAEESEALKNKIFGKKKALERAAELDAEVLKLRKQIEENNAKIAAKEKQRKAINAIDVGAAFKELVKEMDYFVVWRSVEES